MSETATEKKELQDVQNRLMEMLDSVCLDPNATPKDRPAPRRKKASSETTEDGKSSGSSRVKVCPNCKSDEPWGSSSWCPSCGYYPSLKRKVFSDELAASEVEEEEEEELDLATMATMVPIWIYIISGGLLFLLMESLAIRLMIPEITRRSPIAIIQILIGLNVLGISHIRAYFIAAHENENLNIISILWTLFEIWKTTFAQMPRVAKTLYGGAWGLAAVLFAIAFIGVDYGDTFSKLTEEKKKPANPMKAILSVASKTASVTGPPKNGAAPQNMEDALKDFAGDDFAESAIESATQAGDPLGDDAEPTTTAEEESKGEKSGQNSTNSSSVGNETKRSEDKEKETPPKQEFIWSTVPVDGEKEFESEYLVIGYLTNASGQLRSVVLAETLESGAVRFAGKYTINILDKSFIEKLQKQLEQYRTRHPAMKTPYIAKWTAPYVKVQIVHNGVTPDGRIEEGQIRYFQNKPPR